MEVIYQDRRILAAVKPRGVLSTDEPGGMPSLLREYLGDKTACVKTVHRLDRAVGGVMVFARSHEAARRLSAQVEGHTLDKSYLAVLHGTPPQASGVLTDLLYRDRGRKMTFVATEPGKEVREARLSYRFLAGWEDLSLVRIQLFTGRTHQIRVQFASRGLPLAGDKKYGVPDGFSEIALWSYSLTLRHPETGEVMIFSAPPPAEAPWTLFSLPEGRQ